MSLPAHLIKDRPGANYTYFQCFGLPMHENVGPLSIFQFFFAFLHLGTYLFVLVCMIKGKLYRNPFFLQLIGLGVHQVCELFVLCLSYVASFILFYYSIEIIDLGGFMFLASVRECTSLFSNLMLFEIATFRLLVFIFPAYFQEYKNTAPVLGSIVVTDLALVILISIIYNELPIYVPTQMTLNPLIHRGGKGVLGKLGGVRTISQALTCVMYIAMAIRIYIHHKKVSTELSVVNSGQAQEDLSVKAERNALKLSAIVFILHLVLGRMTWFGSMASGQFWRVQIMDIVHTIVAGYSPFVYLVQTREIRKTMPGFVRKLICYKD